MTLPGVHAIEVASLKCWPALDEAQDGAWLRRAARGYTKRANSVQCLNPADDDEAAARLEDAAAWFIARGLPPTFRVTPLAGTGTIAALAAAGWGVFEPSNVLSMPLAGDFTLDERVEATAPTDVAWLEAQRALQSYDQHTLAALAGIVGRLTVPAAGLVLRDQVGTPLASALVAVADDMVWTGNVITGAAVRGQGFGTSLIRSVLAWGADNGAHHAIIQVMADNTPAKHVYESLGYRHQYDYHYRRLVQP